MNKKEVNRVPNRTCKICKSLFYSRPSDIRKGGGIYCSNKCKSKDPAHREKVIMAQNHPLLKKRRSEFWKKNNPSKKGRIVEKAVIQKRVESRIGGFWYGNVRYDNDPQYCELWNENLRLRVRAYWRNCCFLCGKTQKENNRKLSVHHVHYNKKTCCDQSPRILVPLCDSCHSKTNTNRKYWEHHITTLLYKRSPTGKCFFTKDEFEETMVKNN